MRLPPRIAILPPGALGVAFFAQIEPSLVAPKGEVGFLERASAGSSSRLLREAGRLRLQMGPSVVEVPGAPIFAGPLADYAEAASVPSLVLICTNPDQLPAFLEEWVGFIVRRHAAGYALDDPGPWPQVVLCPNGIYYQRIRQIYIELLEEATLLGRLPDLWPKAMPMLVSLLLRGVTLQTGLRLGSGADALYRPGPASVTRLCGGSPEQRETARAALCGAGLPVEDAGDAPPTRVEFDKAIINLCSNLLGQIFAIDAEGRFTPLRVRDIYVPEHEPQVVRLIEAVVAVGKAVGAYPPDLDPAQVREQVRTINDRYGDHQPSSLQRLGLLLEGGHLPGGLPPTEAWLLEPLIKYAKASQLNEEACFFERLKTQLVEKLELASARA